MEPAPQRAKRKSSSSVCSGGAEEGRELRVEAAKGSGALCWAPRAAAPSAGLSRPRAPRSAAAPGFAGSGGRLSCWARAPSVVRALCDQRPGPHAPLLCVPKAREPPPG